MLKTSDETDGRQREQQQQQDEEEEEEKKKEAAVVSIDYSTFKSARKGETMLCYSLDFFSYILNTHTILPTLYRSV